MSDVEKKVKQLEKDIADLRHDFINLKTVVLYLQDKLKK